MRTKAIVVAFLVSLVVLLGPSRPTAAQPGDSDYFERCEQALAGSRDAPIVCMQLQVLYTVPGFATLSIRWDSELAEYAKQYHARLGGTIVGLNLIHPDPDRETRGYLSTYTSTRVLSGTIAHTITGYDALVWSYEPGPYHLNHYRVIVSPIVEERDGTTRDGGIPNIWADFRFREDFTVVLLGGGLEPASGDCAVVDPAPKCFRATTGGEAWNVLRDTVGAVVRPAGTLYPQTERRYIDTICDAAPAEFPATCRDRDRARLRFDSGDADVIRFTNHRSGPPTVRGPGGVATMYVSAIINNGIEGVIRADDVDVPAAAVEDPVVFTLSGPTDANLTEGHVGHLVTATANRALSEDVTVTLMRDRALSAADDADFTTEPIVIRAGGTRGLTMVTAVEDNTVEGVEQLVLYGVADDGGDVRGVVSLLLSDAEGGSGEREVLRRLFDATGGTRWTDNTSWLSDQPISTWYGVATDGAGRVTHLRLQNNGLTGIIPAELASLEAVTHLWFNDNDLTGSIPSELGGLAELGHFSVDTNRRLTGSVPPSFANLSTLWTLRLEETALSGALPQGLTNLRNLRHLSIGESSLCAPNNEEFRTWVESLSFFGGEYCSSRGTLPFTDDPIVPGMTAIKAAHFTELRARIDTALTGVGLDRFPWTDSRLVVGITPIRGVHMSELRAALAEAYDAARRTIGFSTEAVQAGWEIRARHINELRRAVESLESPLLVGGLDLDEACRIQTADNEAYATLNGPVRGPSAAYGWACVSAGGQSAIDFDRACRDTYGSDTVAHPADDDDAYSWGCYRNR